MPDFNFLTSKRRLQYSHNREVIDLSSLTKAADADGVANSDCTFDHPPPPTRYEADTS